MRNLLAAAMVRVLQKLLFSMKGGADLLRAGAEWKLPEELGYKSEQMK
jgi:hypothetical protein